jgi:CRP-like cAMP-binding protein
LFFSKLGDLKLRKLDESLLGHIPPFRNLSRPEIRAVLDLAEPRRFAASTAIFDEGQFAERFYLLLDGHIRVIRTTEGGDQVIALHIVAGQLFGIAAAIGRDTYPATAMSVDDCLVLSWPTNQWSKFIATYDGFATESYKVVGERMGEMNNRLVEMATQQVEQRVARAVLRLINQSGKKIDGGIEIDFPITRQNLSDMTGTTLHTVSRLMSAWEKGGLVKSSRRHIVVTDAHGLVVLSEKSG